MARRLRFSSPNTEEVQEKDPDTPPATAARETDPDGCDEMRPDGSGRDEAADDADPDGADKTKLFKSGAADGSGRGRHETTASANAGDTESDARTLSTDITRTGSSPQRRTPVTPSTSACLSPPFNPSASLVQQLLQAATNADARNSDTRKPEPHPPPVLRRPPPLLYYRLPLRRPPPHRHLLLWHRRRTLNLERVRAGL